MEQAFFPPIGWLPDARMTYYNVQLVASILALIFITQDLSTSVDNNQQHSLTLPRKKY